MRAIAEKVKRLITEEKAFTILIERDEDGYYVAEVAELPGCHTQAKDIEELMKRMEEAIRLYMEVEGNDIYCTLV